MEIALRINPHCEKFFTNTLKFEVHFIEELEKQKKNNKVRMILQRKKK